jgi:hypothetical protein
MVAPEQEDLGVEDMPWQKVPTLRAKVGMLAELERFRALPAELRDSIREAMKLGITQQDRADMLLVSGRMVTALREVANEIEQIVREYQVEGGPSESP